MHRSVIPRRTAAGVLGLAVIGVSALLTFGGGPSAGAAERLTLRADSSGKLKFDKKRLSAQAGKVTIVMTNPSTSGTPHAIAIEGKGLDKDGKRADPGGRSTVSATLKKGTYRFYCPVDRHRAGGMKGTLTVK